MPNVGGVFVPKNPAFEAKHPRDKSGRDRGQFIDVPGVMNALGAEFDHERGVWNVPVDRLEDLDKQSKEMGFKMMSVPKGMRPLRSRGALASGVDPVSGAPDPKIGDDLELEKKYGIPPGYTDVMVSDDDSVEVLAVGRDEKGRKQTVRNKDPKFKAAKDAEKYARISDLDDKIDAVDRRLTDDAPTDDTAAAMMVVRKMGLRPGSTKNTGADQYAYGASTLERRHVRVEGDTVHLEFDSKKGGHTVLEHEDAELARVLRTRMRGKAGGDQMFPKANDRKMNAWVDETVGEEFDVKDFRTHLATSTAAALVADMPEPMTAKEHRNQQLKVGAQVAKILGNTREESLKSYIDPTVWGPVPGDADADMRAPEPPGETGRKMLKRAFDAGHTEHEELTGGVSSESVKRVTLSDGTTAVLKKPKPDQIRRDIVSGVVANALGFDQVHTIDAGEGRLLTEMVDGRPGGKGLPEEQLMAHVNDPGGREMGLLDWLVRNRDRHGGNWIVTPDGVVPIDHGLTNFGPENNDRDIPRGVFAKHWLGLTQKPTGWAARGKSQQEARIVKGPRAKLAPKFSKQYLDDVRPSLEGMREEMTEDEWNGMMERFDIVHAAAPDVIPGEEPFRGKPDADLGDADLGAEPRVWETYIDSVDRSATKMDLSQEARDLPSITKVTLTRDPQTEAETGYPWWSADIEMADGTHKYEQYEQHHDVAQLRKDLVQIDSEAKPTKPEEPAKPEVQAFLDEGLIKPGDVIAYRNAKWTDQPFERATMIGPSDHGDGTTHYVIRIDGEDFDRHVKLESLHPTQIAPVPKQAEPPKAPPVAPRPTTRTQPVPPRDTLGAPGARHAIPNDLYVSSKVEWPVANADSALREAGVDLSALPRTGDKAKVGIKAKKSLGLYHPNTGRIDIAEGGRHAIVTTLHEFGHKLDWELNGDEHSYGSEQQSGGAMGPGWDAWKEMRAAVEKYESEGWKYVGRRGKWATLRRPKEDGDGEEQVSLNWAGKPFSQGEKETGGADLDPLDESATVPEPPPADFMQVAEATQAIAALRVHPKAGQSYGKYLLRPREVFARAFAQYVAMRSQNSATRAQWMEWQRESSPPPGYDAVAWNQELSGWNWSAQWTDEDFAPLAGWFDDFVERSGLKFEGDTA